MVVFYGTTLIFNKLIMSYLLFMKEAMLLYNRTTFRAIPTIPFVIFYHTF